MLIILLGGQPRLVATKTKFDLVKGTFNINVKSVLTNDINECDASNVIDYVHRVIKFVRFCFQLTFFKV